MAIQYRSHIELNSHRVSGLAAAVSGTDAVNLAQVSELIAASESGAQFRGVVKVANDQDYSSDFTYSNGTDGVGATLTFNYTGVMSLFNDVPVSLGDFILFAGQGAQSGVYQLTDIGSAETAAVFTRAAWANSVSELDAGSLIAVLHGDYAGDYFEITTAPTVIGTDPIVFTMRRPIVHGAGFFRNLGNISVREDVTTGGAIVPVAVSSAGVGVDRSTIVVAGDGLDFDPTSGALSINADSETGGDIAPITISANGLGVSKTSVQNMKVWSAAISSSAWVSGSLSVADVAHGLGAMALYGNVQFRDSTGALINLDNVVNPSTYEITLSDGNGTYAADGYLVIMAPAA